MPYTRWLPNLTPLNTHQFEIDTHVLLLEFPLSMVAPKERKHLSADSLFHVVRSGFATIPDPRGTDVDITLKDALMSAFAMFSLKAPSLLAFDKERAEGNLHTIYGIQHVPCDTYMRERLDPVSPKWLRPVFTSVFRQLQRGKALEEMVFLDGRSCTCTMRINIIGSLTERHRGNKV